MYEISFVCENKKQGMRLRECLMEFFENEETEVI